MTSENLVFLLLGFLIGMVFIQVSTLAYFRYLQKKDLHQKQLDRIQNEIRDDTNCFK